MEIVQEMPQFERKVTFYPYSERKNDCNPPLMFSLKAVEAELLSLPHPPFLYPSISHSQQPWMLQIIRLHLSCRLTVVTEFDNNRTHAFVFIHTRHRCFTRTRAFRLQQLVTLCMWSVIVFRGLRAHRLLYQRLIKHPRGSDGDVGGAASKKRLRFLLCFACSLPGHCCQYFQEN